MSYPNSIVFPVTSETGSFRKKFALTILVVCYEFKRYETRQISVPFENRQSSD
jgi:hypothetical protein